MMNLTNKISTYHVFFGCIVVTVTGTTCFHFFITKNVQQKITKILENVIFITIIFFYCNNITSYLSSRNIFTVFSHI